MNQIRKHLEVNQTTARYPSLFIHGWWERKKTTTTTTTTEKVFGVADVVPLSFVDKNMIVIIVNEVYSSCFEFYGYFWLERLQEEKEESATTHPRVLVPTSLCSTAEKVRNRAGGQDFCIKRLKTTATRTEKPLKRWKTVRSAVSFDVMKTGLDAK